MLETSSILACFETLGRAVLLPTLAKYGTANLTYLFEDYSLDTERRELWRGSNLISLEPQVFDLLDYLIRNRERVVSKDDVFAAVWDKRIVSESALTSRMNAARIAIGDSGEAQRLIRTLRGKGFRFVGAVREEQRPDAGPSAMPAAPRSPTLALPDRPSIAVLPFTNMSSDPEQDYFADGMAEEIITALSRCKWLFVIARNSSFTYRGKAVDVRQVGQELGVRYVLEGSVRRAGNRLRFTGQLIDAASGRHIWANRFDGEMSDVFDLQDRFTESVVAAIEPSLQLAEIERLKSKPAANLDAYDLLLRAQQLEYAYTEESLAAAASCLKEALAIDPEYAPALALAAYCYAERNIQGWAQDPEGEAAEGLRLASRALDFGRDDANVLWMAAYAIRRFAQDTRRARELAHRSLLLNPNSAIALAIAGWMEAMTANPEKALELLRRAQRLSPRDPRGWFMAAAAGLAHFSQDRFEEAAAAARETLDQNPRFAQAKRMLAASLAQLGQRERAAEIVQEVLNMEPDLTLTRLRARLRGMDERIWSKWADGLRLAGLPE
jgi:TolB-like protein/Flp pilus assembly protein TadD